MELLILVVAIFGAVWWLGLDKSIIRTARMADRAVHKQEMLQQSRFVRDVNNLEIDAEKVASAKAKIAALESLDI